MEIGIGGLASTFWPPTQLHSLTDGGRTFDRDAGGRTHKCRQAPGALSEGSTYITGIMVDKEFTRRGERCWSHGNREGKGSEERGHRPLYVPVFEFSALIRLHVFAVVGYK